jgi:hypothetical protein
VDEYARLRLAIARLAHGKLHQDGFAALNRAEILNAAKEQAVSDHVAEHVLRKLQDEHLLETKSGHSFTAGVPLLQEYERVDAAERYRRNALRREILTLSVRAYESNHELAFQQSGERFVDRPYGEAITAAMVLDHQGLVALRAFAGRSFRVRGTAAGYDTARSEADIRTLLPTSPADDEAAHAQIVGDVLSELIVSLEAMLSERGWENVIRELRRGDAQADAKHWPDAVREYYAALESGLKYRLDEKAVAYGQGTSLRDLSKQAANAGLIPINYQALFGFTDSIRSPRSHGAGAQVGEIEVGPAEALLVGNHVRTLLLYLGHRPR